MVDILWYASIWPAIIGSLHKKKHKSVISQAHFQISKHVISAVYITTHVFWNILQDI